MDRNLVLRSLPPVDRVLGELADCGLPAPVLARLVRDHLADLRATAAARSGPFEAGTVLAALRERATALAESRLRPVLNATGVLIHTNLGRSPLAAAAGDHLRAVATGYCNVELDLADGKRGPRAGFLEACLAALCEAEAATAVNNCAAALVLVLRSFINPERDEVVVSRGELVEIGGGFRIPEILEASGARLREVGTTNRTRAADYHKAIGPRTALLLKVHRSNFSMQGFTAEAGLAELAALAGAAGLPLVHDLGSGAVLATDRLAPIEHEPTPAESLAAGAGLVCFSGDKLLGGPQSGIIAGRRDLVERVKREPFFRALRCDKLILAALQETVAAYLDARSDPGRDPAPVVAMLRTPVKALQLRADALAAALAGRLAGLDLRVAPAESRTGGGTMPGSTLPSLALDLVPRPTGPSIEAIAARLRRTKPPVIGHAVPDAYRLNLRTIFPDQDETLAHALLAAFGQADAPAAG
jgi:L-seryl-tRNA(Ser) seleniumtransferase